jgi:hypothetical protein
MAHDAREMEDGRRFEKDGKQESVKDRRRAMFRGENWRGYARMHELIVHHNSNADTE